MNLYNAYDSLKNYIILSGVSFCMALIFFAFYNQWVVVYIPRSCDNNIQSIRIQKKQIQHHYFHGDKWKSEKQELLWHTSNEKNIFHLVNTWLALLDEEHVISKKTTVQSVLIDVSGCIYLSFDHAIFGKEDTIFNKWMLIEGLLKTIITSGIVCSRIQFLVQHEPLHDAHLDFSQPWPLHGFMK